MKALLLIDLQNDFLPPNGSLAVEDGSAAVAYANDVMPNYSLIVATKDWHPAGHNSFASSHPSHSVGDVITWEGLSQVLWPDHCVQNTAGAEFSPLLNHHLITHTVTKGTNPNIDSYSGFFDNGHRQQTELDAYLKSKGVTEVDILGLATDYCVKFTALDALKLGYATTVLRAGCRAVNLQPGDEAAAIDELRVAGAVIR